MIFFAADSTSTAAGFSDSTGVGGTLKKKPMSLPRAHSRALMSLRPDINQVSAIGSPVNLQCTLTLAVPNPPADERNPA
jgi:hypothetical protein